MGADTVVRARVASDTKQNATAALDRMGLSMSDAIRLFLVRVAEEQRLPFEVKVPNATTQKAMVEMGAGKGKAFKTGDELLEDLGIK